MKNRTTIRQKLALILAILPLAMVVGGIGSLAQAVCAPGDTSCVSNPPPSGGSNPSPSGSNPSDIAPNCNNSSDAGIQKCLKTNPIVKDLNIIVNFLSGLVGIVVIGTIIVGGIQYTMAGNSPEAVNKAKQRIMNGVLALVVYLLIFGFLQWVVPGGVFNS